MTATTVVLADDQPMVRAGFRALLQQAIEVHVDLSQIGVVARFCLDHIRMAVVSSGPPAWSLLTLACMMQLTSRRE